MGMEWMAMKDKDTAPSLLKIPKMTEMPFGKSDC